MGRCASPRLRRGDPSEVGLSPTVNDDGKKSYENTDEFSLVGLFCV